MERGITENLLNAFHGSTRSKNSAKTMCTYFQLRVNGWRIQLDCQEAKTVVEIVLCGNELGDLGRIDLVKSASKERGNWPHNRNYTVVGI